MRPDRLHELRAESARHYRRMAARTFSAGVLALVDEAPASLLGPVEGDVTPLYVYDYIDPWGVTAASVAEALAQVDTPTVEVRVNSPGGDVFDGITIHNLLRSAAPEVRVRVDGLAASSASVIAMGADTRRIMVGAQVMIHDPWSLAIGNAAEMRIMADLLDAQGENIAGIYAARTGRDTAEEWRDRMRAEGDGTWFMADAAIEIGLATEVEEAAPAAEITDTATVDVGGGGRPADTGRADTERLSAARRDIRRQRILERA